MTQERSNTPLAEDLLSYVRIDLTEDGGTRSMIECDKERLLGLLQRLTSAQSETERSDPVKPLAQKLLEVDAARWRFIKSNVQAKDRMVWATASASFPSRRRATSAPWRKPSMPQCTRSVHEPRSKYR